MTTMRVGAAHDEAISFTAQSWPSRDVLLKAARILTDGQTYRVEDGVFLVPSQSLDGHWYRVTIEHVNPNGTATVRCTCPARAICCHVSVALSLFHQEVGA